MGIGLRLSGRHQGAKVCGCDIGNKDKDHDPQSKEPKMVKQIRLFAQPYDVDACGFYFSTSDEFVQVQKIEECLGNPVEEFGCIY